jgi:hypothetical protein
MTQGAILNAARHDNTFLLQLFLVLTLLCGGVVALNGRYVYNFITGPYPATKAVATAPGMHEFVRAEGQLIDVGAKETSTSHWVGFGINGKLLAAAANAVSTPQREVSARFLLMKIDDGLMIAKVKPDFTGRVVQGRMVPLPTGLQSASGIVYPYMLDTTLGYRSDPNLFILIAGPLFPMMIVGLVYAIRNKSNVLRHPALKKLARHGAPLGMIPRIEREMQAAGEQAHVGSFWITPNWIVVLSPFLHIFAIRDLAGVGLEVTIKKDRDNKVTVTHKLAFWTRGKLMEDLIRVTDQEAVAIVSAIRAQHPWLLVDQEFQKRWLQDKDACARDTDARRKAAAAAAAAATSDRVDAHS